MSAEPSVNPSKPKTLTSRLLRIFARIVRFFNPPREAREKLDRYKPPGSGL